MYSRQSFRFQIMCITQSWACQYCIRINFIKCHFLINLPSDNTMAVDIASYIIALDMFQGTTYFWLLLNSYFSMTTFSRKASIFTIIGDYINVGKYPLFLDIYDYPNIYCIFRFAILLRSWKWLHGSTAAFTVACYLYVVLHVNIQISLKICKWKTGKASRITNKFWWMSDHHQI